jgi:hypothetical protein
VDHVAASERKTIALMSKPARLDQRVERHGAPLTVDASVRGLRKILSRVRLQESGTFLSYDGSAIAW